MAGPAAIFREIHRHRSLAQELQARIDLAPKQVKAQRNLIAKSEEELKQGQDEVKKFKVTIHEHEVSIKAENQLIKKYEQQLGDISSKKEYDALRHEIAVVRERIKAIEDEALTAMLELDERAGQLPAFEASLKKSKADFEAFERDLQTRLEDWSMQRDQATAQLASAEANLPEEIRPQYERLARVMGADALAAVEGKNCTACYTEVTPQMYNDVLTQQFVVCRNCGRVLYSKG